MSDMHPARDFVAVTESDDPADNWDPRPRAIYVGTTGDLYVINSDGTEVAFIGVPAGAVLPIRPLRVTTTTDADDIVALW